MKRLFRSRKERMAGGICGGPGEHTDVDPPVIRLVRAVVTILSAGFGLLVYIVAWILFPETPEESMEPAPGTA